MDHGKFEILFRVSLLTFGLLIGLAANSVAAQDGEITAGSAIPTARDVDETTEILRKCAAGSMKCKPILPEESKPIIASRNYDSWALFLICNQAMLHHSSAFSLAKLFEQFTAFGNAIGRDNAAVWFVKKKTLQKTIASLDNLDIDRNVEYCNKFKLDRQNGPHVVVTKTYPDLKKNIPLDLVVSLGGGLSDAAIEKVLTALTTEIGNEQLDQAKLDRKIWLLKLEQALERGVSNVGDAVANLKVTAKAYGVEVTVEHGMKPEQ